MVVEQHGEYLVGVFGPPSGRKVCVKPAARFGLNQVKVDEDVFFALAVAAKIPNTDKKVPVTELLPSAVERICRAEGTKVRPVESYVLSDYFTRHYRPSQLVNYQSCGPLLLEEGTPSTVLAAVPVAGPGCGPVASANNEARAIEARVVSVANRTEFPPDLVAYGKEFAELVVTRVHKGVPWSIEELRVVQSKPTQRARRRTEERFTADHRPSLTTSSFQKRETYAKVGDPRLINQVPTDHTNRLCAYAGAFKEALCGRSNKHWFMVGKTPLAVAHSLRNLRAHTPGRVVGGDYSRMDGRTSVAYRRHVLKEAMMRFFHPTHHAELDELLSKEETARTVTRGHGVRAEMGGANLSGSGVTTILNTLDSAFNEFAARRRAGQSGPEAFKRLGCYFGDDSVVCQSVFEATVQVAKDCGMKLEPEPVPEEAGEGYVVFLSRVYPDIRVSLASHPCIVRALKKACMVQVPPGADEKVVCTKLKLKAEGVLVADSHVPVLASYARALKRVYRLEERAAGGAEWLSYASKDASYTAKTTAGAYPYETQDREALIASIGWSLGLPPEEVDRLDRALDAVQTEEELMQCSLDGHELQLPEWASWVPTNPVAI
nr:MAG: reverse transcriptase-like protein [Sanya noda-like virus]